ncbi:MAG: ABC transporter permease [Actinomycetota bacterium]
MADEGVVVGAGSGAPPGHRAMGVRRRLIPYYLLAPGGLYLTIFFLLPLGLMIYTSLQSGGVLSGGFTFTWEFQNYADVLGSYESQFIRSIVYSLIVTFAALLLAYPMTYWIAFYAGRWKSSFLLLILLPFFVSFIIRTVQWKFILGDNGPILGLLKGIDLLPEGFRVLATPFAVIAGITYNFLPFTALPLYVSLERIDKRLIEASKDLYATRWQAFRKVVWPLSLPGVFAAFLLTFVPATGDYVNSQLLGGPGTTMIGQIIQTKFLTENDYPEAAALSVILMVAMVILASVYARILGTEEATRGAAA